VISADFKSQMFSNKHFKTTMGSWFAVISFITSGFWLVVATFYISNTALMSSKIDDSIWNPSNLWSIFFNGLGYVLICS
jgi:hypothetical protein